MDGDRHNYGRVIGGCGGSDQGPSGQGPRPPAPQQTAKYRPPHLRNKGGGSGGEPYLPPLQRQGVGRSYDTGPTRRPWDPHPAPPTHRTPQLPPNPCTFGVDLLKVSEEEPLSCHPKDANNRILPVRRPKGGTLVGRSVNLLVNHFLVEFNPRVTIFHYNLDIKQVICHGKRPVRKSKNKMNLRSIRDKLFSDDPARFPLNRTAYDGEKNLYSAILLPTGQFRVELSDNEDLSTRTYVVSIKLMNELKLSKLEDYLTGKLPYVPRDILQGMDLVMKENPSRYRISVDRSFYSSTFKVEDDLKHGIAAYRGFQSSLRPTSQGLALCLDCSVLAFRKPLAVIDFLKEHIAEFDGVYLDLNLRRRVTNALKGLTVRVTHRVTKQTFTITGLTAKITRDLWFDFVDPKGIDPTVKVSLVQYFREKYGKEIAYQGIPCLILGRNNRTNHVPMEFCVLAQGQRYRKELLDEVGQKTMEEKSLAWPPERRKIISEMMQAYDGPCGDDTQNFGLRIDKNMTSVEGRVIGPPDLKLGAPDGAVYVVRVENEKCQWNLAENSVVDGKQIERWALIEFSSSGCLKLRAKDFIQNLRNRARSIGICMEEPLVCHFTHMREFSSVSRLEELLRSVIQEASRKTWNRLQIIVCVMAEKHHGYKYLKWVSETRIGVVTQCCLSSQANRGDDQFLGNLCLKINAKLGGSNVELTQRLPHFDDEDHVMFIGADVNHPVSKKATTPSIAAVVSSVNWPAVNRYAARVSPQDHRTEKIVEFGPMCHDLIDTYFQLNKVKPKKIIVFRDGVSEGQFDMVLNEELSDLKSAVCSNTYQPKITLVVAQKRHQTRLFLENMADGGATGNVPPGTVVDTKIVHPFELDFYLCSHYGRIGTSKAVRYCVLWDENSFASSELQKLIYNLCFTFARSTRPVSLVPPVYYADLVAYRGRIFQEVAKEFKNRAVSSSTGTSNSSTFDQSFYSLHPDLQNIMFFV
ncbi:Translation initiation factor 2C (eIF-2C) [Handroanthus impetiginosus]|uniref:Translation initiation factor 2C (eIF-2C) n=1 Tax=Handroanthus impetiginosus TaxID=429701 RepID=A0A2G9HZE2_9LAMI|nr:Translation initiation factor 2C (eIF-2C) [Handroanthus impetiginosus]